MTIECVGVVGLGLLGRGIAACLLGHGMRVVGYARSEESQSAALRSIEAGIEEMIEFAGFDPSLRETWRERYTAADTFKPLVDCTFVIESVVEDAEVKQVVFDSIEMVVDASTTIASNTSAIPIGRLQANRRCPERFIGMHWAEPAHATSFLELIRGEQTSDRTMHLATALARRIGKDPSVLQKDVPGFIVNRIAYAMYREALHLLESGVADVETIDRSFRNACGLWATMCGPFRWMDLTGGPALYARAMSQVLGDLNNSSELPEPIRLLSGESACGIANGRGFYSYTPRESEHWEAMFRAHAWKVRAMQSQCFVEQDDVK
ncbi:MAG: 3-hydroxyacyl-CoA dehydrogenase family protein [Pirellulales bacterium]|nr:3-hydroxyacyl-CoA dehydrogenase family protein [Pirellulales bacterium]